MSFVEPGAETTIDWIELPVGSDEQNVDDDDDGGGVWFEFAGTE